MLHAIGVASPPSLLIACATSVHLSALRLEITTCAPARAIASAIARPMPLVEPVITATFPVRSNSEFAIHRPPFSPRVRQSLAQLCHASFVLPALSTP